VRSGRRIEWASGPRGKRAPRAGHTRVGLRGNRGLARESREGDEQGAEKELMMPSSGENRNSSLFANNDQLMRAGKIKVRVNTPPSPD
jgi:hypothetical protein